MKDYQAILNKFYQMEVENHLFDIQDSNGIYVWDIVRYKVFVSLFNTSKRVPNKKHKSTFLKVLCKIYNEVEFLLLLLFVKRDYFFLIVSRNRYNNTDVYFDQNSYNTLRLFNSKDCFLYEIYSELGKKTIYDSSYTRLYSSSLIYNIFKNNSHQNFDFHNILNIVSKNFAQIGTLTEKNLCDEYQRYYNDYSYYKMLLSRLCVKKMFVTQAGVQKGLFAAAHDLNISIVEFHHGIVYDGHMLYSYPRIENLRNRINTADYIFSLSQFWFNDIFLPYTKVIPVGNDYFVPKSVVENYKDNHNRRNNILVISSSEQGISLKDFLIEGMKKDSTLENYNYLFKLHPNQFSQKEIYKCFFSEFPNVTVVSNEKSVPELLADCETLFTIQSTAVFEALQFGNKVIVYKRQSYETMKVVFDCDNLYLIDSVAEFVDSLKMKIIVTKNIFFEHYNKKLALETLKKI